MPFLQSTSLVYYIHARNCALCDVIALRGLYSRSSIVVDFQLTVDVVNINLFCGLRFFCYVHVSLVRLGFYF